jgi:hypothetical protein
MEDFAVFQLLPFPSGKPVILCRGSCAHRSTFPLRMANDVRSFENGLAGDQRWEIKGNVVSLVLLWHFKMIPIQIFLT